MSTSTLPEGLSPAEIDAVVSARVAAGEDLYRLDEGALAELDADVVLTQDLCAVCAVDLERVDDALAYLGCTARVLTLDPQSLDEVLLGARRRSTRSTPVTRPRQVVDALRARLGRAAASARRRRCSVRRSCSSGPTRRSAAGHWVPDLVAAGGGTAVLASPGRRLAPDHVGRGPSGAGRGRARRAVRVPPGAGRRAWPSSSSPTTGYLRAPRCGRSTPTATSSDPGPVSSTAPRPWRRSCIPRSSALRRPTGRDESTMAEDRMIELEGWQGPSSDDDPDAELQGGRRAVLTRRSVDDDPRARPRARRSRRSALPLRAREVGDPGQRRFAGARADDDATPRPDLRRCRARRHRRGTLGGVPTAAGPHLVAPVPVGPSGGLRAVEHDHCVV